jgi:deoxyribonuclease-1-like protein
VYIVVHTDPDKVTREIDALDAVVEYARGIYPAEQDFIVMDDLNADGPYFDEDGATTMKGEAEVFQTGRDGD